MPEFLSPDWVEAAHALAADLAEHPGVDAVVQIVVVGATGPEAKHVVTFVGGRPLAWAAGTRTGADVTITVGTADWRAIGSGSLDPAVAFMRGAVKAEGDHGCFLAVLAAVSGADHRALRARLLELAGV